MRNKTTAQKQITPIKKKTAKRIKKATAAPVKKATKSKVATKAKKSTPLKKETVKRAKKVTSTSRKKTAKSKVATKAKKPTPLKKETVKRVEKRASTSRKKTTKGKVVAKTKKVKTLKSTSAQPKPKSSVAKSSSGKARVISSRKAAIDSKKEKSLFVFSLEEARGVIDNRKKEVLDKKVRTVTKKATQVKTATKPSAKKHLVRKPASTTDILGFNPNDPVSIAKASDKEDQVPKKFLRFYKMLLKLRTHVLSELDLHTQDTLQHDPNLSPNIDNGDTDNMDREFALSLVSSEHEALFEIEEAIQRIHSNTYGICEITGAPISKERLLAVPFTRFSVQGQTIFESQKREEKERKKKNKVTESSIEDITQFTNEDSN